MYLTGKFDASFDIKGKTVVDNAKPKPNNPSLVSAAMNSQLIHINKLISHSITSTIYCSFSFISFTILNVCVVSYYLIGQ